MLEVMHILEIAYQHVQNLCLNSAYVKYAAQRSSSRVNVDIKLDNVLGISANAVSLLRRPYTPSSFSKSVNALYSMPSMVASTR